MPKNFPILERLVGLETEYAIRFVSEGRDDRTSALSVYEQLVDALRIQTSIAPAAHFKKGQFLANGGAVWFETIDPVLHNGLIEGSTPECTEPREVLIHQRAQDRVLANAFKSISIYGSRFRLLKNSRDAKGSVYGSQENYEANLGNAFSLIIWRIGLVLLVPIAILTWFNILLMILVIVLLLLIGVLLSVLTFWHRGLQRWFRTRVFSIANLESNASPLERSFLIWLERIAAAPLAICLAPFFRFVVFRKAQKLMMPFLVSRSIIGGSGSIDANGNFLLAEKAPAHNCQSGFCGILLDRPIFNFGHFFKPLYLLFFFSPRDYLRLFSKRQRLQINLGDSNMCEVSEYLRVGTTALILDAIEAGFLKRAPKLKRPIKALKDFCADSTLTQKAKLVGSESTTALEIQRYYYEICKQFVNQLDEESTAAEQILDLWKSVLDKLESDPDDLVGSLDWVTKNYLIEKTGKDSSWETKKKIDIRYHELDEEGYFARLAMGGFVERVSTDEEIEKATRVPPAKTRAATRGSYIREFGEGDEPIKVNWQYVYIGKGKNRKVIRLDSYGNSRKA